jgi:hypothetical protein
MTPPAAVPVVPAPPWLIVLLHGVTFVLHFAAMNVLVASAFHLAFAPAGARVLRRRMAGALPPAFSLTITLGVAPLLFLQLVHGERFYASSIQMAWPWLGILVVLMAAYYAAYAIDGAEQAGREPPTWLRLLPFGGLVVFSFVMACNVALSERPDVLATLGKPGTNLAILETNVLWRWSHELAGAIALGSLWLLPLGVGIARRDEQTGRSIVRRGAMTAMVVTVVSVLLGVVQLLVAPSDVRGAVGGASLGVGILAGLGAVGVAGAMMRRPSMTRAWVALGLGLVTLSAKTVLRFAVRDNRLEQAGGIEAPLFEADFGPIALFIVCLLLAVALLGWLLRVLASAAPAGDA